MKAIRAGFHRNVSEIEQLITTEFVNNYNRFEERLFLNVKNDKNPTCIVPTERCSIALFIINVCLICADKWFRGIHSLNI